MKVGDRGVVLQGKHCGKMLEITDIIDSEKGQIGDSIYIHARLVREQEHGGGASCVDTSTSFLLTHLIDVCSCSHKECCEIDKFVLEIKNFRLLK